MTQEEIRKNNPLHKKILLDSQDRHFLNEHSWCKDSHGYASAWIDHKCVRLHHLILLKKKYFEVDHVNRNPLDNRRCNLRYVTRSQNCMNCSMKRNNSSGYKGVCWNKEHEKWVAQVGINKRKIHLGYFTSKKKASKIYQMAVKDLFGEYAGALEAEKLTGKKIKR